jgi:hypothetical protein
MSDNYPTALSDDAPISINTTQREVNYVRALAERERQTYEKRVADTNEIVKVGYSKCGNQKFDEAAQALVNAHGGHVPEATLDVLRSAQMPHDEIMALADDPARLQRFAKMSPEAQRAEISHREVAKAPYGRVNVAADPAYKNPALSGGPISDTDWNSAAVQDRLSDKDFYKEMDRRWEERAKKRGVRW